MMIDAEYRWPAAGQAWRELPEQVRAAMTAHGAAGWREVFDGRATYNQRWRLARPPVMTADALRELNVVADRLAELVLQTCQRRAATAGELRRVLGVPPGQTRLLDEAEPLSAGLLAAYRPDVLLSDGVPRFVEYNIDSSLGGGFDADTVVQRYDHLYRRHGAYGHSPVRPAPSLLDQRFVAIRSTLGLADEARVALLIDFDAEYPGLEDPQRFIRILSPLVDRARSFGIDLVISPLSEAALDADRRLVVGQAPVDALFRLFVPNRVTPGAGLDAVAGALAAGTLPMFVSAAAWLLGNKLTFAWLWQDADALSPADRELVRRHVPYTVALTADVLDLAVANRRGFVAKPADGSAGVDVLIGREVTAEAWRAGLRRAVDGGGHILQEYVEADLVPMDFVEIATGDTVTAEVSYSVAPYLFDRTASGALVRVGYPGGEGVLNLARGVLMTGVMVVD